MSGTENSVTADPRRGVLFADVSMSGIENSVTTTHAAQALWAFVIQPRVRRTLGTKRHPMFFEDQPQRGCVHRRTLADGHNPVGIGPSMGIGLGPVSQGCSNPGLYYTRAHPKTLESLI